MTVFNWHSCNSDRILMKAY